MLDRLQHPADANPFIQFFTPVPDITANSGGPFADPGVGNLGNIKVNSYRGPRAFFADAAVFKNFSITERVKAQFRMDAFNVFNHPVLGFNSNQGNTCIDCGGQCRADHGYRGRLFSGFNHRYASTRVRSEVLVLSSS